MKSERIQSINVKSLKKDSTFWGPVTTSIKLQSLCLSSLHEGHFLLLTMDRSLNTEDSADTVFGMC